jgi:hypothetical protein
MFLPVLPSKPGSVAQHVIKLLKKASQNLKFNNTAVMVQPLLKVQQRRWGTNKTYY